MEQKNLKEDLNNIAQKVELRETQLLDFLAVIDRKEIKDKNKLIRAAGIPKATINKILEELKEYLEPLGQSTQFRPEWQQEIHELLAKSSKENSQYLEEKICALFASLRNKKPLPKRQYDQFYATDQTTAKRALTISRNGDLDGRKIALLGDDDLTSVACALTGTAEKITVLEVDGDIIELIEETSQNLNLGIETIKLDLRDKLPPELARQYDTVFTDPPYTPAGISLFLNSALFLLKKSPLSRIYFCCGGSNRAREKELIIQKIVNEKGLLIKEKFSDFNHYHGAQSIGSTSSLYVCDWTTAARGTPPPNLPIYTFQQQKEMNRKRKKPF